VGKRPILQVQDVHKWYGRTQVLNGINMAVDVGDVTCLIGPSGSGKTTLLRCINHLEKVNSGRLYVDGALVGYGEDGDGLRELKEKYVARARAQIGMVFQQFNLFHHMTALQNIIEGPVGVKGEPKDAAIEHARALLARVGLAGKDHRFPRQLSGGEQQRVAIARALAMRPKLMLFDEPTSALDPELVSEVLEVIRGVAADGMTMLIVTHEMNFAREVADQVVFMEGGRIVETGPPSKLFDDPANARTRSFLSRINR